MCCSYYYIIGTSSQALLLSINLFQTLSQDNYGVVLLPPSGAK